MLLAGAVLLAVLLAGGSSRAVLASARLSCIFCGLCGRPGAKPPHHGPAKHVKRMPKKRRRRGGRAGSLRGGAGSGGGVAGLLRLTSNLLTSESSGASSAGGGGHIDYDEQADVVRFLEDGSFIGQYGGPKREPTASGASDDALPVAAAAAAAAGATSVSMTALSTFV